MFSKINIPIYAYFSLNTVGRVDNIKIIIKKMLSHGLRKTLVITDMGRKHAVLYRI